MENKFVNYLNTLHNEQSGNANALAESQINNEYFRKIEVNRPAANYIANRISNNDKGCLIILTGHAGDGKTTLLFQTLGLLTTNSFGCGVNEYLELPNGKTIHYVKDFSELTSDDRENVFSSALTDIEKGIYTILVANTGPLIDTFKKVFKNELDAENTIIDRMDATDNYEKEVYGYPLLVLNIALLDNTGFIEEYTKKLITVDNWSICEECTSANHCPVNRNVKLLRNHPQAIKFLRDFYIWELEHDRRATIRQISAHIAYSLTGGLECGVISRNRFRSIDYLFSNLLFGEGKMNNKYVANQIRGIKMINDLGIDSMTSSFDYSLYVQKDYKNLFINDEELNKVIAYLDTVSDKKINDSVKRRMLKRLLLVFLRDIDNEREKLYRDIFSAYYPEYLYFRNGSLKPSQKIKNMILQALRITFAGQGKENEPIYLTLRRSGESIQNVQLLIGRINIDDLYIKVIKSSASEISSENIYQIELHYNKKQIKLSLPLLNYFEKITKGMIITQVDPLLSYGIESLKSELLSVCHLSNTGGNEIEMLVRTDSGCKKYEICIETNKFTG